MTSAPLPAGWTTRRPTLDDVPAIQAVVHASDIVAIGYPDFPAEVIQETLNAPNMDLAADTWLAVDPSGAVVAWAYLDNPTAGPEEFAEVYVHPEHGVPAQAPLLDLLLARARERCLLRGHQAPTIRGGAVPTEKLWIAVLRAAGFDFIKRYARMKRPLSSVSPLPPPPGVAIRPLRADDEADLREFHRILDTAFRDTPDYRPMTYDLWRERVAAQSSVAWDEWFVAEVDGVPGGILQSSDQGREDNVGWVKYLAVLREHRKRGLGAALLNRAFVTYAANGRTTAGLGVDLSNPTEAYRLYTAVGMTAAYEADIYERPL